MSGISLASKLAIAFIRPFRSYIDGYMLIKQSKPELEQELKDRMEILAKQAKEKSNSYVDEKRIEYAKECMIAMNLQFLSSYDKNYEEVLPTVIEELTLSLEKEIKSSFSEEDIEKLVDLVNNPMMKVLLANKNIFSMLKKYEAELDYKLLLKTYESVLGGKGIEDLKAIFNDLKKKHHINDDRREDDFGGLWDDNPPMNDTE